MRCNKRLHCIGMRLFFAILFISSFTIQAQNQEVLVPFRDGHLFGLANLKGKVVLKPIYMSLRPIGGGYFEYEEATLSDRPDAEEESGKMGVLKGARTIISETPHRFFTCLAPGLIIGTASVYQSDQCNFYSDNGEPLLPEPLEQCRVILPTKEDASAPVAVLARWMSGQTSILIYDVKKKQFTTPLLDKVADFQMERPTVPRFLMVCSYLDKDYQKQRSVIYFNYKLHQHVCIPYQDDAWMMELYQSPEVRPDNTPAPSTDKSEQEATSSDENLPRFRDAGQKGLFYSEQPLTLNSGEQVLFASQDRNQTQPLIFYNGHQYSLRLNGEQRLTTFYDTLLYLKQPFETKQETASWYYLAGKKGGDNTFSLGLLDASGKVIVPFAYTSFGLQLPSLRHREGYGSGAKSTFYFEKGYENFLNTKTCLHNNLPGGVLLAKRNGKYGILSGNNELLIPIQMDSIWRNGIEYPEGLGLESQFYGYRKGDRYGAFEITQKGMLKKDTGPVFKEIPTGYYEDYMGVSGLEVYQVSVPGNLNYGFVVKQK